MRWFILKEYKGYKYKIITIILVLILIGFSVYWLKQDFPLFFLVIIPSILEAIDNNYEDNNNDE